MGLEDVGPRDDLICGSHDYVNAPMFADDDDFDIEIEVPYIEVIPMYSLDDNPFNDEDSNDETPDGEVIPIEEYFSDLNALADLFSQLGREPASDSEDSEENFDEEPDIPKVVPDEATSEESSTSGSVEATNEPNQN